MRILLINKYLYPRGGDAVCTLQTGELLAQHGHEVFYWGMAHPSNAGYPYAHFFFPWTDYRQQHRLLKKIKEGMQLLYNFSARDRLSRFLQEIKPGLVHLHNFAHQLSPSVLDAIAAYGIPMVMTLHDYKPVCAVYRLLCNGRICDACGGGHFYHCLLQRCTDHSFPKSLLNTLEMYLHHRVLRIYEKIALFIAPSIFMQEKVQAMGFRGKVAHLPNYIQAAPGGAQPVKEESIVFAGRLSPEKGLTTLLEAVRGLKVKVKILGTGPLQPWLTAQMKSPDLQSVQYLGHMDQDAAQREIARSLFAVLPSLWYENNPVFILEAFAAGVPVIGSNLGGIPELIRDGITGYICKPGNSKDFREKIDRMLADRRSIREMGNRAQEQVLAGNHPGQHYTRLMELYREAAADNSGAGNLGIGKRGAGKSGAGKRGAGL